MPRRPLPFPATGADGREPTIADRVAAVIAEWNDGALANGEVTTRIIDLLTAANVAEVVAATPDEWRAELVRQLRDLGSDGELIFIFGGVYRYELESDPVRRAEMQAEVERERAAENAHFEQVIRPAVRAWLRGQPPDAKS